MQRVLMILEVSQKQKYIFASKVLKENIQRSADIARVTSSEYFAQVCPRDYDEGTHLVYSGGGHTVLQFPTGEEATAFARRLTRQVIEEYPGLELFVKQLPYDEKKTPGQNLNELSRKLEIKKSRRDNAFRTLALGIEQSGGAPKTGEGKPNFRLPDGWREASKMDDVDKDDNFLAVVHIDGNAMGTRVQAIYDKCKDNWPECNRLLNLFSREIDQHYEEAFDEMAQEMAAALERTKPIQNMRNKHWTPTFPLRKIIGAGDDVCFLTTGRQGLECAASFLRHLSTKMNHADGKYYTACAGVVLVHKKYPFREAYDLSEELCRSAKNFCAEYKVEANALDFHIEYGQLKDSLAEIRDDYVTDDGARLELRPLCVKGGEGVIPAERTYAFHKKQLRNLLEMLKTAEEGNRGNKGAKISLARSKVKSLRPYLHQGETETEYALKKTSSYDLLRLNPDKGGAFFTDEQNVRRCLYFDTIELLDVTTLWQEVSE